MPVKRWKFLLISCVCTLALVAASCGGDSDSATTASNPAVTTTGAVADTTTTSTAPAEVLITFDGAICSVIGGPLEPGFAQSVSVMSTSPNPGGLMIITLTDSYQLTDVAADAAAGRYFAATSDDPVDIGSYTVRIMAANATEPTIRPFTATTGSFAVLCFDTLEAEAFLAREVFEVS